jgi:hypothetical protein
VVPQLLLLLLLLLLKAWPTVEGTRITRATPSTRVRFARRVYTQIIRVVHNTPHA